MNDYDLIAKYLFGYTVTVSKPDMFDNSIQTVWGLNDRVMLQYSDPDVAKEFVLEHAKPSQIGDVAGVYPGRTLILISMLDQVYRRLEKEVDHAIFTSQVRSPDFEEAVMLKKHLVMARAKNLGKT